MARTFTVPADPSLQQAQTFVKKPSAILDYAIDWSGWLGSDTIVAATGSTWVAQNGITPGTGANGAPAPSHTTTIATLWLIGGVDQVDYKVTNRIVTTAGRHEERSLVIQVRS